MNKKAKDSQNTDLWVLGFDPVFLDIIVTPLNPKNKRLNELPNNTDHITNNEIKMIPGGNSLNLAKILQKLTSANKVIFVGNFNKMFEQIILQQVPKLKLYSVGNKKPNITVALQLYQKELQFNMVSSDFGIDDLTIESLLLLTLSKVVDFSNIGLNPSAFNLFNSVACYFIELHNKLKDHLENDINIYLEMLLSLLSRIFLFTQKIDEIVSGQHYELISKNIVPALSKLNSKIFFFDPSTLEKFQNYEGLDRFFSKIFGKLPGYKIISLNSLEFNTMKENKVDFINYLSNANTIMIQHGSKEVLIYKFTLDNPMKYQVPTLFSDDIITTVGAGDAFNAGFLFEFSQNFDLNKSVIHGIKIAQQYITNTLYLM